MTGTGLDHKGISSKNYQSHSAFSPVLSKATNSDFFMERVIQVCLEDFQDKVAISESKYVFAS